eukprot:383635_1
MRPLVVSLLLVLVLAMSRWEGTDACAATPGVDVDDAATTTTTTESESKSTSLLTTTTEEYSPQKWCNLTTAECEYTEFTYEQDIFCCSYVLETNTIIIS